MMDVVLDNAQVPHGFISSGARLIALIAARAYAPPEPARAPQACFETLVPVHDSVSFGEGNLPRMNAVFLSPHSQESFPSLRMFLNMACWKKEKAIRV